MTGVPVVNLRYTATGRPVTRETRPLSLRKLGNPDPKLITFALYSWVGVRSLLPYCRDLLYTLKHSVREKNVPKMFFYTKCVTIFKKDTNEWFEYLLIPGIYLYFWIKCLLGNVFSE